MAKIQQIQQLPLPESLEKAIANGPLPVVWAYRRKRRARTLPPAYVLMYYCEGRVPLDRGELAASRQRYFKNARTDGTAPLPKTKAPTRGAPRKPRVRAGNPMGLPRAYATGSGGDPTYGNEQPGMGMVPDPQGGAAPMCGWPPMGSMGGSCPVAYGGAHGLTAAGGGAASVSRDDCLTGWRPYISKQPASVYRPQSGTRCNLHRPWHHRSRRRHRSCIRHMRRCSRYHRLRFRHLPTCRLRFRKQCRCKQCAFDASNAPPACHVSSNNNAAWWAASTRQKAARSTACTTPRLPHPQLPRIRSSPILSTAGGPTHATTARGANGGRGGELACL